MGAQVEAHDAALLDALLEDAPVGFAFYTPDGRYLRINRRLAEINQAPPEAHHGRRPTEILPPTLGVAVENMLDRVLTTGRTYVDQEFSAEVPTANGAAPEVRHWRSSWYLASRDGETLGVAVLVVDVTDQVRADERLRRSKDRTLRLLQATSRLAAALTVGEVAQVVGEVGAGTLGAVGATFSLLTEDGWLADVPTGRVGGPTPAAPQVACLPDPITSDVLRSGRPLYPPDGGGEVVLPLVLSGAPLGLLRLVVSEGPEVTADDRVFLESLAGQCAQALDRARLYEHEHRVAVALQHSLLPSTMPQVPGLELTARYRPGAVGAQVGGDWYDAFTVADGKVALVLGDMMGKGIEAAAGMGRLRSAVRTVALLDPDPRRVLTAVDRVFAATEPDENLATVVLAVIDPPTGDVVASDAGHLPLLLLRRADTPGGPRADLVDASRASTPLGWPEPRTAGALRLEVGDVLLAFSDGLVESRRRPVGEGLRLARDVAWDWVRDPGDAGLEAFLDGLVARLTALGGDDDVTLLAVRRVS
ncbi:MAG: SpoIIE family protein phosphatase [Actinomycetes bacterium]